MPEQCGETAGQHIHDGLKRRVPPRDDDLNIEICELCRERIRVCEIGFGESQDGNEAPRVRRDERALHQPGARRGIGNRHHDKQLIGVGDKDPFKRISVIGCAAQHRSPFLQPYDACQRVGSAGQIAHQADGIAHHDRSAAEFTGTHRGHLFGGVVVEHTPPAAAVHGDHHRGHGVGMVGTILGARPRASARPDAGVGLVVLAWAQEARPPD